MACSSGLPALATTEKGAQLFAFVVRRVALSLLVILGVAFLTFVATRVLPSDPVSQWVGPRATPQQRVEATKELGLDKPILVQFGLFLKELGRGNLGRSLQTHQQVVVELKAYLPPTLELVFVAIVFAVGVGVPLGILSASRKNKWQDHMARVMSVGAISMPTFWLALVLQLVFFRWLHLLPLGGRIDQVYTLTNAVPSRTGFMLIDCILAGNWLALGNASLHLLMPAIALGASALAVLARMTRSSMLESLNEDYIGAAKSYGLGNGTVLWNYALKNSMGPIATVGALMLGYLLVNTFLVETIFNWPGIGSYITRSVGVLDYPAIIGVTLISAFAYVLLNMAVDIVIALDRRVAV